MTDNAEAEKVHATAPSSGDSQEPLNGDQAQRPDFADEEDLADEEEAIDPDAVIIEEDAVVIEEDAAPVPADDELDQDPDAAASPAATGAHARAADETDPHAIPADVLPADAAAADVTPTGPTSTAGVPSAGVPSAGVPSAGVPSGAVPSGAVPSGAVPGAARPGMPADPDVSANADGPADTGIAGDAEQLHQRWAAIQSAFVDDPRGSVAAAAELTTETISALVASAQQRERGLRGEWDRDGVDTEGLRNALRSYRRLLDQLVAL